MIKFPIHESIIFLDEKIKEAQYNIAKCQFVQSHFSDAKVNILKGIDDKDFFKFSSKMINNHYSKYEFSKSHYTLNIKVYTELNFSYNNKNEIIRVNSSPETCRLARTGWSSKNRKSIIMFSKFSFNMKKNNFKDDIFNDCRVQIMQLIQENPNSMIDTKNLEPRLKKLLLFT